MRPIRRAAILCALLLLASTSLWAADTSVGIIARKMGAATRAMRTFQGTCTMTMGSGKEAIRVPVKVAFQKPNKFRLTMASPGGQMQTVMDGVKLYAYNPQMNQVVVTEAPKDLEKAPLAARRQFQGMTMGIMDSFYMSPETIAMLTRNARLQGTRKLGGRDYYVLRAPSQFGDTQYWVDGKSYLLSRMEIEMQGMQAAPGKKPNSSAMAKQSGLKITIATTDVQLNKPIPASTFRFAMPKGAKIVRQFSARGGKR